uniref:AlNc14C52G4066 protein n=1 Tax=Albugo laibachii Nc14 TaxID=890382 RepID=F0WBM1_9STRA|nr:AlNc14C52G4066 [Albugo laibachii Nc14]|eukprot:CCA18548.1 AlNc14C52G4066 [Albugo laibachii Nc14]
MSSLFEQPNRYVHPVLTNCQATRLCAEKCSFFISTAAKSLSFGQVCASNRAAFELCGMSSPSIRGYTGTRMPLSQATALLRTRTSHVAYCLQDPRVLCSALLDVPEDICGYEEGLIKLQNHKTEIMLGLSIDLNELPLPESGSEHTISSVVRHGKQVVSTPPDDPSLQPVGTSTIVMHFELEGKMRLLECFKYLVLYEEVLLVSFERTYVWLTKIKLRFEWTCVLQYGMF